MLRAQPHRYAWDEQFSYSNQGRLGFGPKGLLFRYAAHKLRIWDVRTAHGPDLMLANSSYIARAHQTDLWAPAQVVFPPVPLGELPFEADKDDYYVTASFLAPYKRTDLVIHAFAAMPSGAWSSSETVSKCASCASTRAPTYEFVGFLPRADYRAHHRPGAQRSCLPVVRTSASRMVEAQAYGTPLIAFGRGGATDIVRPLGRHIQPTGILFERQTTADIVEAVEHLEDNLAAFTPDGCRANAARFGPQRFARQVAQAFAETVAMHAGSATNAAPDHAHDAEPSEPNHLAAAHQQIPSAAHN